MSWALIRLADGAWLSGPSDAAPMPGAGEIAIEVALGYPETCEWSPERRGFVDLAPSTEALTAERDSLFTRLLEIEAELRARAA